MSCTPHYPFLFDSSQWRAAFLSVSSRGWRWFRGPGEWYELVAGEPVLHLQWPADRVHPTTAQWTERFLAPTPPPPSSHAAQPAPAGSALTRAKPHLPGAGNVLLACRLVPPEPPAVTTHAHSRCQVGDPKASTEYPCWGIAGEFCHSTVIYLSFIYKYLWLWPSRQH